MNKKRATTRGIANKGFRGMRRVAARFNFSCNLTGNHPQSLTCHTANVKKNKQNNTVPIAFFQNPVVTKSLQVQNRDRVFA
jgi:hypothetical protein